MSKVNKLLAMALTGTNDQERLNALNSMKTILVNDGFNLTECQIGEYQGFRTKILELMKEENELKERVQSLHSEIEELRLLKQEVEDRKQKTREYSRVYGKNYYQQNKEKCKASTKAWRLANPDKMKEYAIRNKDKKRQSQG